MYYVLPIVLVVFLSYANALDCGEHGRVLACPCTRTCGNPKGPHFCPCIEGCSCNRGFLLDEKIQKCVRPDQCPLDSVATTSRSTCGEHSHIEDCPCKRSCDDPKGPSHCKCQQGCTCNEGYLFDDLSGSCVASYDCTKINVKVELTCGRNSHLEPCPCKRTCLDPKGPILCPCDEGCTCDEGYVLDEGQGVCVLPDQCAKPTDDGINFDFGSLFKLFDFDDNDSNIFPTRKNISGTSIAPLESSKPPTISPPDVIKITPTITPTVASTPLLITQTPQTKSLTKKVQPYTGMQDLLIIFETSSKMPISKKLCDNNSHLEVCPCDRTCSNPQAPTSYCICVEGCACDFGFVRSEISSRCVRPEECIKMIDDVQRTSVVYRRSFLSWCFSPEEPLHLFFSLLICCLIVALICSFINIKKKARPTK